MSLADGRVIGLTKIVDHGPSAYRWDLVIAAEGFQEHELPEFYWHADSFVRRFQETAPFDEFWDGINISRLDVVSDESGADDPTQCGGTGQERRTFFDASFCDDGVRRRLLAVDTNIALPVLDEHCPDRDVALFLVNSPIYGGSGSSQRKFAVASLEPRSFNIVIHELGHAAFQLTDEYCEAGTGRYSGPEPSAPNVSVFGDGRKWSGLLTPGVPLPTFSNPGSDCAEPPYPPPPGTVGTFEGGMFHGAGIFRAEMHCYMRDGTPPFCAVCRSKIASDLSVYLP